MSSREFRFIWCFVVKIIQSQQSEHVVVLTIFSKCVTLTPIFQSTMNRLHFFPVFDLCSFYLIFNRVNGDGAKKCENSLDGWRKSNLTFVSVRGESMRQVSSSCMFWVHGVCCDYHKLEMGLWGLITAGRQSFGLTKQCQCHLFSWLIDEPFGL